LEDSVGIGRAKNIFCYGSLSKHGPYVVSFGHSAGGKGCACKTRACKGCYAQQGRFLLERNKKNHEWRKNYLIRRPAEFFEAAYAELRPLPRGFLLRLYSSGDVWDQETLDRWKHLLLRLKAAKTSPSVFWPTRRGDLDWKLISKINGVNVFFSADWDTSPEDCDRAYATGIRRVFSTSPYPEWSPGGSTPCKASCQECGYGCFYGTVKWAIAQPHGSGRKYYRRAPGAKNWDEERFNTMSRKIEKRMRRAK
jgi:hypothetical protein